MTEKQLISIALAANGEVHRPDARSSSVRLPMSSRAVSGAVVAPRAYRATPPPASDVGDDPTPVINDVAPASSPISTERSRSVEADAAPVEYLLIYGQPRTSINGDAIVYEVKRRRAKHAGDDAAIGWATLVAPYESGLTHAGKRYPAVPMVLRCGRSVVWESRPGMALRAAG